jgi:carboxyl-terminal processing protease
VDTSTYSDYYRQLINKGIFNRFILQYVDSHRDSCLLRYPDFDSFRDHFQPGQEQLDELVAFAEKEGLSFDQEQWDVSREHIALLMKGYIARDLWSMARFYEIYNTSNEMFIKAVEILEDPALLAEKLGKAE